MRRRRSLPVEIVRALGLLAAFLVTCLVGGILASGFLLPGAAASSFVSQSATDYYNELPDALEIPPLPERSTIVAADGSIITHLYSQNRFQVPLSAVSQTMVDATISIEDGRFYDHNGVDVRGTTRALVSNLLGAEGTQGGSTLTQQYVKNVLLEQAAAAGDEEGVERAIASRGVEGYRRKLAEARYALAIEQEFSKDEILERYLNIANFGNLQYGISAAAYYYFQVDPGALTVPQAALLAGMVQRPRDLDPTDFPDAAKARRDTVMSRMRDLGKISEADYAAFVAQPLGVTPVGTPNGCSAAGQMAYFCQYVIDEIIGEGLEPNTGPFVALGPDANARTQALYRGGLTIQTTIQPGLQNIAWQSVRSQIGEAERAGVALVTVEPRTGKVLAMAQNRQYPTTPEQEAAALAEPPTSYTYTEVNYSTGGSLGFQPGSTFKPFTLATWLASGRTLLQTVDASQPFRYRPADFPACGLTLERKAYEANNAGDSGGTAGGVPVVRASFNSINTAYMRMAQQLDLCAIGDTARSLGVSDIAPTRQGQNEHGNFDIGPSLVLGVASVSPLAMSSAYAAFAAEGLYCPPTGVTGITNRLGEPIAVTPVGCTQALEPDVAKGVNNALQQTLTQGTARSLGGIGRPAAGKTGTTQNFKDTWFIGYTPNLASAVWIGDSVKTPAQLNQFPINGRQLRAVYGSTFAVPTWGDFMRQAPAALGLPPDGFAEPPQRLIGTPPPPPPPAGGGNGGGNNGGGNGGGGGGGGQPPGPQPVPGQPAGQAAQQAAQDFLSTLLEGRPERGPDAGD